MGTTARFRAHDSPATAAVLSIALLSLWAWGVVDASVHAMAFDSK